MSTDLKTIFENLPAEAKTAIDAYIAEAKKAPVIERSPSADPCPLKKLPYGAPLKERDQNWNEYLRWVARQA